MSIKKINVPKNSIIAGAGTYFSKDSHKTQLNNNVLCVGTSGAGKTRSIVGPNLLMAEGSYIISDPKGNLYEQYGPYLRSKGYEVTSVDFIHPELSCGYNPLAYIRTTSDIRKVSHTLTYELSDHTGGKGGHYDPFWDKTSEMLISAMIGYLRETDEYRPIEKNLITLSELIREGNRNENFTTARGKSELDKRMERHRQKYTRSGKCTSWAVSRYDEYNTSPDKTHATINICALANFSNFDSEEVREMFKKPSIDFARVGQVPSAVFVQVSDTDRSMDALVNLFYTQMMNELCSYADSCPGSRLPVPVQFILDDFSTNARIDNFQNIIANIRSREISAMLFVQSEAQLSAGYGDDAQTIVDNCNTYIYMGGTSPEQAEKVGKRANRQANSILNMPVSTSWVFRRGSEPVFTNNFDLENFAKEKGFIPGEPCKFVFGNKEATIA